MAYKIVIYQLAHLKENEHILTGEIDHDWINGVYIWNNCGIPYTNLDPNAGLIVQLEKVITSNKRKVLIINEYPIGFTYCYNTSYGIQFLDAEPINGKLILNKLAIAKNISTDITLDFKK